jgi:methylase of polypeptide subunit release factors
MLNGFVVEENQLMYEVDKWEHSDTEKGQIYTRPEVVNFMIDIMGLGGVTEFENIRVLEPSCGEGEFVVALVERFITQAKDRPSVKQLLGRILAIDLVGASVEIAKAKVKGLLARHDYSDDDIQLLLSDWFSVADFLLEDVERNFTHVIGNPPYVRVENIPRRLLDEYRRRYSTMTDRADLYIPFFEKSLSLMVDGGKLSFICTDRWTKNTYGKSLRQLIGDGYSLEVFIDLYGIDAFEQSVMTYPAITQITKNKNDQTVLVHGTLFTKIESDDIQRAIGGEPSNYNVRKGIVKGPQPWLLGTPDLVALIRKLERQYPALEDAGCKVFIGAATGSNKIYVVDINSVDIEESRLLPVITANELKSGEINWKGKYLVNTYDEEGVVFLDEYPKLSEYLNKHKPALCKRHVAKMDSSKWYKTIDRVYESRCKLQKLMIPDISNDPIAVYDKGDYHPNNSIYYICSDEWNLQALRVVLLSSITKLFISTYSTKIAHGYLRFQAQHLRKLRLPVWSSIDASLRDVMIEASLSNNIGCFDSLTCEMYGLTKEERAIVGV